jgi:filamentous hemagglutinin
VRDLSFGITGLAPLIPTNRLMGPMASTAEEVAVRGFPGAEATATARGTYRGGAGGNWRVFNEGADSAVAQQATSTSCGQACAQMLLSDRGMAVQQAAFGSEMTSAQGLAGRLNTVESGWIGSGVSSSSFQSLNQTGSWSAMMWERGARSGHWVVVDGVDNAGFVMVRDPFNATRYQMTRADFLEAWNGYSVFRPK